VVEAVVFVVENTTISEEMATVPVNRVMSDLVALHSDVCDYFSWPVWIIPPVVYLLYLLNNRRPR